ncbi:MAG: type II toxin-antitoxin system HicB family antitoxin, partial [Eggerthellaceae bacterium]|nr:type II toxin-antitoxin system HicB family antitoxin [Eggerthellaceae bacterium]
MEKYVYGAIIRPDEDGGFWAEIPDLPGCYGQGETFSETIDSIIDGLETQLAYMAEDGLDIPPMSKITAEDGEVVYIYANPATVEIAGPVMSAAEAARALGVTPGRVSQLIRAGKLR